MTMILLYSRWLNLPISTRQAIAQAFNIHKKNPTHVVDNLVRDDGYVIGDVESALTAVAMEAFVGAKFEDANALLDAVVAKAEGRVVEPVAVVAEAPVEIVKAELVDAKDVPVKAVKKVIRKK